MNNTPTITIEAAGCILPTETPVRILTYRDAREVVGGGVFSELTGPYEAFKVTEGRRFDTVLVVKPDLVTIKTYQVA